MHLGGFFSTVSGFIFKYNEVHCLEFPAHSIYFVYFGDDGRGLEKLSPLAVGVGAGGWDRSKKEIPCKKKSTKGTTLKFSWHMIVMHLSKGSTSVVYRGWYCSKATQIRTPLRRCASCVFHGTIQGGRGCIPPLECGGGWGIGPSLCEPGITVREDKFHVSMCRADLEHPWGGVSPTSLSGMEVGEVMQAHGTTCNCTFSVLLHIALCVSISFFVFLLGGVFHFASHPTLPRAHPTRRHFPKKIFVGTVGSLSP